MRPRLRHLVVVVPGIGGSVLHTADRAARWDEHRRRFVAAATRPHRLGLDAQPDLVPVGLLPDITLVGPFVTPGYDALVRGITRHFDGVRIDVARPGKPRDLQADLLLFPYDFRRGVQHAAARLAAEIADRLSGEHPSARHRRVIVVAHSLGGLVARHWLGPLGGAPQCAALITLGTPHRGAPKALDVLVNGLKVGPKRLSRLTDVLRQWPSVYELLPRYPAVGRPDGTPPLRPHELPAGDLLAPAFLTGAKAAFAVHQDIEAAWTDLDRPPDLTAVFGRGHATLQHALLSPGGLTLAKTSAPWLPNPSWLGDGTVPAISAVPLELGEDLRVRRAVPDRHLALPASATVLALLTEYAGDSLTAVRGDPPDRPWLGLDVDDTALSGTPVPVGVTLHGTPADERTRVRLRLRTADTTPPWQPCPRSGDTTWQTTLLPPGPGTYTLDVMATGIPVTSRLRTGEVLGVLDAEALGAES
ncbi:hypothetical protein GCM10010329_85420 [Streptomyces spiroverticillatus]|uniref:Lecithin:cholesterol acyltransferase n=1 Tax=Streptomyces finlayi TaxID=67296 RepID=A0A919CG61_9ACTN|nr:hypothetical protein [Streptomyces finlayi]GHA50274.1 hypothetical protein GCM10010329_85420 [Streptomyces spiroverticillatus]GHD19781.1 hypothetical protein GCM10010334_83710 [Streptomyces finlayi]